MKSRRPSQPLPARGHARGPIIRRVTGHIVEYALNFSYSSGTYNLGRAIVWEIDAGRYVGLGECGFAEAKATPGIAMQLGGGTWRGLQTALTPWVQPLIGCDARALEALLPPLPSKLDWDLLVVREGLSIGLYDLVGRVSGLPVHALLGGRRRSCMPGMPVIHVGPTDVMVRRARQWVAGGYRHLKIKFRGDLLADVEALRAIRSAVGRKTGLVVDANDGYRRVEDALKAIRALAPCGVDYFEDMLNASHEAIADLRRRSRARIMVDRQAWWPDIHRVIGAGAADVINHHPNNQGGLGAALQIDALAAAAGLETAVGSSGLFGIQDAAFMQLAAVVGLTRPCEDIGILPYYSGPTKGEYAFDREPSIIRRPYPIRDGVIHVPDAPGLGVDLDPKRLDRCKVGEIAYS